MADIELVIKIPEEIRLALINNLQLSIDYQAICDLYIKQAMINGIPLPKGHGRLIDEKSLRMEIIGHQYSINFCEEHNIDNSINLGMLNILMADAPTIIEADKENK